MGILNIGVRALQANQLALQTAGNNISNVNTVGYSRQSVIMETVEGQFTGAGYIGYGVSVVTIQRNLNEFLTRQSTLAGSVKAADVTRSEYLKQLEGLFEGGSGGLGASVNEMLNAFADVASAPTDLTARTVALTRVDEAAARMRSSSLKIDDLQQGLAQALTQKVATINTLAQSVAEVNHEIIKINGNGQSPNDLLDRRDQLVREINQYVQTTGIASQDGGLNLFIGGSQALVLGVQSTPIAIVADEFGDITKSKIAISRNGQSFTLDENTLGGGEISGLLRFQNTDLTEGRNLLGRMTLAVSTAMNDQHKLGLDLNGAAGGNLFTPATFGTSNIRIPAAPATLNTGTGALALAIADVSKFVASDYMLQFTSGTTGSITRRSDGKVSTFDFGTTNPVTIDGLNISIPSGTPANGDRYLLKPFSTSAGTITSAFSTPAALAVASPVSGRMGTGNTGSMQQTSLVARSNPVSATPVTLTFTSPTSYTRSDDPTPATPFSHTYTAGQAIEGTYPATAPLSEWSLVLQGSPKLGDTFTVGPNQYPKLNAGNASAMMALRDKPMFDGSALTDGYAGLISQLGIRTQSAAYAAQVSTTIAANLETNRTAVSGVNLDEEAGKLIQYQQAYQASAKVIQIAQSVFDTLIQTMAR
ncbi:flagellar hook-associated protein FlgK [Rhodoferax aquaticus]|uniref:Flagellar hook-associated protein 1 n=1 Tax=Rhodoferax aquaticus TaxID=2527691 RepID=A0A515ETW5_9BURK|nr:flagellar hook-associated protein FlgK [Rhodoferax aquaticus]QDL56116.1 flagellar hook-associated protein FlgK [Rhodoferax aquaticus]